MTSATERSSKAARKLGGAATSSNETPVSSAENPDPADDSGGNTRETRPRPTGPRTFAGVNPPVSGDKDPERQPE